MLSRPSMSYEVGFRSVTNLIRLRGDDADKKKQSERDVIQKVLCSHTYRGTFLLITRDIVGKNAVSLQG